LIINPHTTAKPRERSNLRKFLGKEFFILKRRFHWLFGGHKFATTDAKVNCSASIIRHRSVLLRPLKDVDMHLQHNKVTNLSIAIRLLDKVVIKPGEVFSFWRLTGRPSASKGYLKGLILHNGKISAGTGGGLCQLGNLLYWMALHTPLTIQERWRHSYDVFPDVNRTIPFGCGATLSYNYIDLQLKNNTERIFQVHLWLDNGYLNGEITCDTGLNSTYEVVERDHCIQQQWWGGYTRHNKIWRKITRHADNSVTEELVAENNAILMYRPLLGS
jgi:vancomycin resistance protein VanW